MVTVLDEKVAPCVRAQPALLCAEDGNGFLELRRGANLGNLPPPATAGHSSSLTSEQLVHLLHTQFQTQSGVGAMLTLLLAQDGSNPIWVSLSRRPVAGLSL